MALELNVDSEAGGVKTVVKKEVTDDLDVKARLEEEGQQIDDEKEKPAEKEKKKADDDDEDEDLDFKALSPKQQKAVGRVYKERKQLMRRIEKLERDTEERGKKTETGGGQVTALQATHGLVRPVRPDPTKFTGTEDEWNKLEQKYEDDLLDYRDQVKQAKTEEDEAQAAKEKAVKAFNKQAAAFAEEHEDYEDVMDQSMPLSGVMFGAVIENGPALGYYFAKNPKVAAEIFDMSADKAYRAITRIVVKLEDAAEGEKKPEASEEKPKKKKADPPEVLGGKGGTPPVDKNKLSFKERQKLLAKEHPDEFDYEP